VIDQSEIRDVIDRSFVVIILRVITLTHSLLRMTNWGL